MGVRFKSFVKPFPMPALLEVHRQSLDGLVSFRQAILLNFTPSPHQEEDSGKLTF